MDMMSLRRGLLLRQLGMPIGYKPVEWLYRSKTYGGPYCQLDWSLSIGDQVTMRINLLDTSRPEAAFGINSSDVLAETYYKSNSDELGMWQSSGTDLYSNVSYIKGIPDILSFTVNNPFVFRVWGCYRTTRYLFSGRMYGVTVKNSANIIKHKLAPCIRLIDNEPGFYDLITETFYPNAASDGAFEPPTYIGGLPVLIDNVYFGGSTGNGTIDAHAEDVNWFLTGPYDTGDSSSKSYTCIRHSLTTTGNTGTNNKIRMFNDINTTSYDFWAMIGSDEPRTIISAGRYVITGIYKPLAAESYLYDNTNQRYVFKGTNVT